MYLFYSVILISYFLDVIEEKSLENKKNLVLIGIICVVFVIICFVFVCVFFIKCRGGKVMLYLVWFYFYLKLEINNFN